MTAKKHPTSKHKDITKRTRKEVLSKDDFFKALNKVVQTVKKKSPSKEKKGTSG